MTGYDLESMRRAVVKCMDNIKTFEAEIQSQRDIIIEYQAIIARIEANNGNSNDKARP